MQPSYLLAGGDRRQFWLSRLLAPAGRVFTLGVPDCPDVLPPGPVEVLVLPTPCFGPTGRLRGPGEGLDPACLTPFCDEHTRVFGGALPPELRKRLPPSGPVTDLLTDPGLAAANGRLTAEAALSLTEEGLEGSLFGLHCLVLGYGRIGKPLAALLSAHHAAVTVAARRPEVLAEAAQQGCQTLPLRRGAQCAPADPPPVCRGAQCAPADPPPVCRGAQCAPADPPPVCRGAQCAPADPPPVCRGAQCAPADPSPACRGAQCAPADPLPPCRGAQCAPADPSPADIVFNTIPAPTLDPTMISPTTLWVELASPPGGLPSEYNPPFPVLPANSLPGRRLPRSAAALLSAAILRAM